MRSVIRVPHGIDPVIKEYADPSPYSEPLNAVSVGSMLFDADFFTKAAQLFPQVSFHVIGCGIDRPDRWPKNVIHYNEMDYHKTMPYVRHASIGLAPYRGKIPASLADTSMKLQQYAYFNVPAVCHQDVVGQHTFRYGYDPDNKVSIQNAIKQALAAKPDNCPDVLTWQQVTERLLRPENLSDAKCNNLKCKNSLTTKNIGQDALWSVLQSVR